MAGNNYKIKVSLSDGSVKELPFTAPEGPRGPKGDCRGVSVHEVKNTGELYDLLAGLSGTQKVFAVVANGLVSVPLTTWQSDVQIVRLVQMRGAVSIAFQYAFQKDPGAGGAAVEAVSYTATLRPGGTDKFTMPGSTGSTTEAASLSVYIYDSETPPPSYLDLSEEADYQLFQGIAAGYNWGWTSLNPPALSTISQIQGSFGTQAQVFEIGKTYLALFSGYDTDGLRASVFTVNSDGTSVTWDASKRWEIPIGAHVVMPNGAVYLAVAKPTASNTPIYECVKPISGKIPLEISGPATNVYFSGLSNVSVSFKVQANSGNAAQGTVFVNSCYNSDYYVDCSGLGVSGDGGTTLLVYLDDKNAAIPTGSQYLGESDFASEHPGVQEYRICNGSWGQDEKYIQTKPFADKPTVLMGTAARFYQNFVVRDSSWVFSDGTKLRRDVRISLVGYAPMVTRPLVYEAANEEGE